MIYNENQEYKVKFYTDSGGKSPVLKYLEKLTDKEKAKILKYIEFLRERKGVLDEPYSKHIKGKIRELRVDFGKNRHRIFYFTFIEKKYHSFARFFEKFGKNSVFGNSKSRRKLLPSIKQKRNV